MNVGDSQCQYLFLLSVSRQALLNCHATWFQLRQLYSSGPILPAIQTLITSKIVLYLKPAYTPTVLTYPLASNTHSISHPPPHSLPPSPVSTGKVEIDIATRTNSTSATVTAITTVETDRSLIVDVYTDRTNIIHKVNVALWETWAACKRHFKYWLIK